MNTSRRGAVFLDTSVALGYLAGDQKAREIVESGLELAINGVVYSELVFALLRTKYTALFGRYNLYSLKRELDKGNPALLEMYDMARGFFEALERGRGLRYLPENEEIIKEAGELAKRFGLLPNDALIAATCRFYGIETIATFDEDFKKIEWLKVIP
ncbi:MAG: type II toxin-antitoxin system VapC family toxin [Thermoproteus sp.]